MKSIGNSLEQRKQSKTRLKGAYEASLAQEDEMRKRIESLKQEVLDLQKRSIQYNIIKARGRHQSRALHELAAALQRSRCRLRCGRQ